MGITISENDVVFHVPYGLPNSEGTPEGGFVDVKANPAWIPVLPTCLGWPETQDLLRTVNAPESPLMTLASGQVFTETGHAEHKIALTSFVMLCYAEVARNGKPDMAEFAACLRARLSDHLQSATNELESPLYLQVTLELQPTVFHHHGIEGWSLSVLMAAFGVDEGDARRTWQVAMRALEAALTDEGLRTDD